MSKKVDVELFPDALRELVEDGIDEIMREVSVSVECPECGTEFDVDASTVKCPECGLAVKVIVG